MSPRYAFSFYRNEPRPYIVQHPWWMFWKKPTLAYRQQAMRYSYHFDDDDTAALLIKMSEKNWTTGPGRMTKFLMGDAHNVQLTQDSPATPYVSTRVQP